MPDPLDSPQASWPHLTLFRPSGARPPLVFVAGLDGYAFAFRQLARLFGDDQPVLGLQLPGTESAEEIASYSIEEMAEIFEFEVNAACPGQPLIVGGFSMGALPAFELVRRLRRRGRRVPLMISLDGFAPQFYFQKIELAARVSAHAQALLREPLPYLAARKQNLGRRLLSRVGLGWQLVDGIESGDRATDERLKRLTVLWERAVMRYRPPPVPQLPLLLFRLREPVLQLGAVDDPRYGWSSYVDTVRDVVELRGAHSTFLQDSDNQARIASLINRRVDELISDGRHGTAP